MSTNENSPTPSATDKTKKVKKPKGFIRWEAVIPFVIFVSISGAYFTLFFDTNLKYVMEKLGYNFLGAEVNIGHLETSFIKAKISIKDLEFTDPATPKNNMLKIGEIKFGVLWDGLLRAKFVIEEMAVEQIEVNAPRKTPGKVKPPEPPPPPPNPNEKNKALEEAKKVSDKALQVIEDKNEDNAIGNLVALLQGSDASTELKKIEDQLQSKKKIKEIETLLNEKRSKWDGLQKDLPKDKEFQAFNQRLAAIKTKDFKSPQELEASVKQFQSLISELDTKYKSVSAALQSVQADIQQLDGEYKVLEKMVQEDTEKIRAQLKIPKLDVSNIIKLVLKDYLKDYIGKYNYYYGLYKKYAPPNLGNKAKKEENSIKIHPREKGVTYEFAKAKAYPMFWIKKISVSSKANNFAGDLAGQILNITSNQDTIAKPTSFDFKGDFPFQKMSGIKLHGEFNSIGENQKVEVAGQIAKMEVEGKTFISSDDLSLSLTKASQNLEFKSSLDHFKKLDMTFDTNFKELQTSIASKTPVVQEIFTNVFKKIDVINVNMSSHGELPNPGLDIQSNLGSLLQKGFEEQLAAKLKEAQEKLQAFINTQFGDEKKKLEAQLNSEKSKIEAELKKIQTTAETEKSKYENKMNTTKKEAENDAKKKLESEVKKSLGDDAGKKLDDLKKKFGW